MGNILYFSCVPGNLSSREHERGLGTFSDQKRLMLSSAAVFKVLFPADPLKEGITHSVPLLGIYPGKVWSWSSRLRFSNAVILGLKHRLKSDGNEKGHTLF